MACGRLRGSLSEFWHLTCASGDLESQWPERLLLWQRSSELLEDSNDSRSFLVGTPFCLRKCDQFWERWLRHQLKLARRPSPDAGLHHQHLLRRYGLGLLGRPLHMAMAWTGAQVVLAGRPEGASTWTTGWMPRRCGMARCQKPSTGSMPGTSTCNWWKLGIDFRDP